ncbi:YbaB/EbfC family DNA-binding protein [Telmatospirillum siberiense]|nr:YbaB/EbfC family DNA-binding protein [Telmatospirillum siberiense]
MRAGGRAVLHLLTAALSGVLCLAGPVAAQSPNGAVPQSWSSYAGLVGRQFQVWLMADDDVAYRFHKFLEDRAVGQQAVPQPPLQVKVWINADGQVGHVDFPSLGDARADADLRQLLTQKPLSEPPPPEMRQPLTLRLNLSFRS